MHIEVDRFLALTAMLAGFVPTSGPRCDEIEAHEAHEAHEVSEVHDGGGGSEGARDLEADGA
ncbi:hypothetical protein [Nannocystis sp.]|uniref:hypothetical protein n=1 Tax=Nannocystis sp. TaxID=1962667 RepID=UPI0025F81D79|nr:hypothetical protein [Nannocystis sp.]MBK7828806.1 hypothetical protein [Nannocystis sp.]